MSARQLLFKTLYRLGFVPWDGHPLPKSLKDLIEGGTALPARNRAGHRLRHR